MTRPVTIPAHPARSYGADQLGCAALQPVAGPRRVSSGRPRGTDPVTRIGRPVTDPEPAKATLAHIWRETTRFAQLATREPLSLPVPSYPAFTVETLTAHVGTTLRSLQAALTGQRVAGEIQPPRGPAVIEWMGAGLDPVLKLLRDAKPDELVPFPPGTGTRRAALLAPLLAVQLALHRWDLESVRGEYSATPPDLAVAEIETALAADAAHLTGPAVSPIGGVVQLRASDVGIGWATWVTRGRLVTRRLTGKNVAPDVVASARAQDLALMLWNRAAPQWPRVRVSGASDVLTRFLRIGYVPDPRLMRSADQADRGCFSEDSWALVPTPGTAARPTASGRRASARTFQKGRPARTAGARRPRG